MSGKSKKSGKQKKVSLLTLGQRQHRRQQANDRNKKFRERKKAKEKGLVTDLKARQDEVFQLKAVLKPAGAMPHVHVAFVSFRAETCAKKMYDFAISGSCFLEIVEGRATFKN